MKNVEDITDQDKMAVKGNDLLPNWNKVLKSFHS